MKLSIIIPVYNTEKYLPACLESVLSQRFTDFEVLLVDDGSSDASGRICDEYAEKDSRIRVLHKGNGGVSSARNAGWSLSTGEWICYVDADDFLEEGFFTHPLDHSVDLYVRNQVLIGSNVIAHNPELVEGPDMLHFLQENAQKERFRTVAGSFFLREILSRYSIMFDESFRLGEDTLYMLDYLSHCQSIQVLGGACYRVRRSEEWSNKYRLKWEETERFLSAYWERYDRLSTELPQLSSQLFLFFHQMTDHGAGFRLKWALSDPVLRYKKTQLQEKGIRYKIFYHISVILSCFSHKLGLC